jgi:hypothetical protein
MKTEQHNEHKNVNDILVENEVLANEKIAVDKSENIIEVSFHSYLLQRMMSMFFFIIIDEDGDSNDGPSTESKKVKGVSAD